jgi:hypothetical protein
MPSEDVIKCSESELGQGAHSGEVPPCLPPNPDADSFPILVYEHSLTPQLLQPAISAQLRAVLKLRFCGRRNDALNIIVGSTSRPPRRRAGTGTDDGCAAQRSACTSRGKH